MTRLWWRRAVMSMTPVHMKDHGATLVLVGFTISLHIAGMYAFSPIFGWLSDRIGKLPTILLGQAILVIALLVSGFGSEDQTFISIGLFLIGLGWCLGIINIVLKDTQNFIVFFSMVLMVASPIAYTPGMVPEKLSLIINFNPFAKYIISYQYILVYEKLPPYSVLISMLLVSFFMFFIGYRFFHKFKGLIVNYV
jgi:ABC-type polysaccharide/polyol phosphate export permease